MPAADAEALKAKLEEAGASVSFLSKLITFANQKGRWLVQSSFFIALFAVFMYFLILFRFFN
jgi:hypothetical protein